MVRRCLRRSADDGRLRTRQWRYPYARAYRAVLAESGHLCQTFCLLATSLGLAPFCTMALADSRIERDLRIDGVSEAVIYAAGVGIARRESTGRRGPAPTGAGAHAAGACRAQSSQHRPAPTRLIPPPLSFATANNPQRDACGPRQDR